MAFSILQIAPLTLKQIVYHLEQLILPLGRSVSIDGPSVEQPYNFYDLDKNQMRCRRTQPDNWNVGWGTVMWYSSLAIKTPYLEDSQVCAFNLQTQVFEGFSAREGAVTKATYTQCCRYSYVQL